MSKEGIRELQEYNLEYMEAQLSEDIFGGDYTSSVELKYANKQIKQLKEENKQLKEQLQQREEVIKKAIEFIFSVNGILGARHKFVLLDILNKYKNKE